MRFCRWMNFFHSTSRSKCSKRKWSFKAFDFTSFKSNNRSSSDHSFQIFSKVHFTFSLKVDYLLGNIAPSLGTSGRLTLTSSSLLHQLIPTVQRTIFKAIVFMLHGCLLRNHVLLGWSTGTGAPNLTMFIVALSLFCSWVSLCAITYRLKTLHMLYT